MTVSEQWSLSVFTDLNQHVIVFVQLLVTHRFFFMWTRKAFLDTSVHVFACSYSLVLNLIHALEAVMQHKAKSFQF